MNFSLAYLIVGIVLASNLSTVSAFVVGLAQNYNVGIVCTQGSRDGVVMAASTGSEVPDQAMENAWRYVKKPLISVGVKGATQKHGNSLRQLLEDHTVVKVKVNTKSYDTLNAAYESLRDFAIESGASKDVELIQMRQAERTIMFGLPGTLESIRTGDFPPKEEDDEDTE